LAESAPRAALVPDKHAVKRDPLFRDAANGDFRLRPNSPAIDAGSNQTTDVSKFDYDGTLRPQGKGVDIGAFEAATTSGQDSLRRQI
jgi:hypothetical protein